MRLREHRQLRILDFDLERRPLSYLGGDFTTAEITAICCGWADQDDLTTWLLGRHKPLTMLKGFVRLYDEADMVTGHNIRRFDLPSVNGALIEYGLPPLKPKLAQDTYADLVKRDGLSASQQSLGGVLGLAEPKIGMGQPQWREANRLTPSGIEKTRERVEGDVRQHKAMRVELAKRGLLKPPRIWNP